MENLDTNVAQEKPTKAQTKAKPKAKGGKPPNKERFMKSQTYKWKVDLLAALLKDDKHYTKAEVDALIEKYLKGEVK